MEKNNQGSWWRQARRARKSRRSEFIDENGGGPGVRLRKRQQKKG
jgi:hypothetical protein